MNTYRLFSFFALGLATVAFQAEAAVRLTALQIISTDANGKIQGVGAHRFRTTNHGGHPCIFLVKGDDVDGAIINGPRTAQNNIDIPLSAGTHTYTILAEKTNSYSWTYYTLNAYFDLSNTPQISALAPLHTSNPVIFPPVTANAESTENITGHSVKAPGTLLYKSGQHEVKLVNFRLSSPAVFNKDRISAFEVRSDNVLDYVGELTLEVKAPPKISAGGVVNAASYAPKVAPGSLFSIFGSSLAAGSANSPGLPLSTSLAGASVTIGGKSAPLVFVSPEQINAQVPYEVVEGPSVPVVVTVNGVASPQGTVAVVGAAPGIFQFGQKRAVVQNQDYSVNDAENGAAPDTVLTAYLTGCGRVDNPVPSGGAAGSDPLSRPLGPVTATVNGTPAEVLFGGLTPGFSGLMQVNFKTPGLAPGTYPLVISVNNERSNAAMVTVK